MSDYIPDKDLEFDSFQLNFINYVNSNFTALGLDAGDLLPIQAGNADWTPKWASYEAELLEFRAATQTKNTSRAAYEAVIRSLARQILAYPALTNAQRAALGLNIPGAGGPPPPAPTSRPVGSVDTSQRLQHILRWLDEATGKRAKPFGVFGAQIFIKIGGDPPTGLDQMTLLAIDSASPYLTEFNDADGGKIAYYIIRWVMDPDGSSPGPISETLAATIPA